MTNKILFLHGALGSRRQMEDICTHLPDTLETIRHNLPGHGGRPLPEQFTMEQFTEDTAMLLKDEPGPVDVFGFSMGGYVALLLAMKYPDKVGRIMTLGTKFDWTPETAERETLLLDPDRMIEKVPAFTELLSRRHAPQDWKKVVLLTKDLLMRLGNGEAMIMSSFDLPHKVSILRGTRDHMVSAQESEFMAQHLPGGSYTELDDFRHPVEQADARILAGRITEFFTLKPVDSSDENPG